MTTALWCVLIAILLPYAFTMSAKLIGGFGLKQNHYPRDFLASLDGAAKRANWAQMNSFEILPGFIAAVLVAQYLQAAQGTVDALAITFIVSRVVYGICYITDQATLRSLVWFVGIICIVSLFVTAA